MNTIPKKDINEKDKKEMYNKLFEAINDKNLKYILDILNKYIKDETLAKILEDIIIVLLLNDVDTIYILYYLDLYFKDQYSVLEVLNKYLDEAIESYNYFALTTLIDLFDSIDENYLSKEKRDKLTAMSNEWAQANNRLLKEDKLSKLLSISANNNIEMSYLTLTSMPQEHDFQKDISELLENKEFKVYKAITKSQIVKLKSSLKGRANIQLRVYSKWGKTYAILRYYTPKIECSSVITMCKKGESAMRKGNYAWACEFFLNILNSYSCPPHIIYFNLAKCYEKLNEMEKALEIREYVTILNYDNYRDFNNSDEDFVNFKKENGRLSREIYLKRQSEELNRRMSECETREYQAISDILYDDWNSLPLLIEKFRLDERESQIVKLLAAKRCLLEGQLAFCDYIMQEITPGNLSPQIENLIREIDALKKELESTKTTSLVFVDN